MAVPTTFEKELRKIFDGIDNLDNQKYIGRAFYAKIDNDLRLKAEIISTNTYEHYDALRIRVLRRDEGEIDANTIRFKEACGKNLYMWKNNEQLEWYRIAPTPRDVEMLAEQITDYVDIFQDQDMSQEMGGMSM